MVVGIEDSLNKVLKDLECPVIVEGRSDAEVLKKYGVQNIVSLDGRPLYMVAKETAEYCRKALVLTDFDAEGEKIAGKLNVFLDKFNVVPKNSLRGKIKRIVTKEGISQIENIPIPS